MALPTGEQLRQTRQARRLSIEQAAQATRIRVRYLEALENGDSGAFPSPAQERGFLRAYTQYLKLDLETASAAEPKVPTAYIPSSEGAPASEPQPSLKNAEAIFAALGQRLRSQREMLSLSLDDVERHTHLRAHYIRSLEAGNLSELPSPVQGRGMLNNYARFLGLDPDPLLLQFAEGLQARLTSQQPGLLRWKGPEDQLVASMPSPIRRFFSIELATAVLVVVFLLGFMTWGAIRIVEMRSGQTITPTAPSIAEVLASGSRATPSPTLPATPTPPGPAGENSSEIEQNPDPSQLDLGNAPVQVYVVVSQRAWMRATVDGEVEFQGRVMAGSAYPFLGNERVEILTGNGMALQVYYNRTDQGILGTFGEVVQRVYTLQGVLIPTATITVTPLPTTVIAPTPGTGTPPVETTGTPSEAELPVPTLTPTPSP